MAAGHFTPPVHAQQPDYFPRSHHAWARFVPGSWTRVRRLTEDLDAQGNVDTVRTTETTTTLIEVSDNSFKLQMDVVVEVAGKRFAAQPKIVHLGFSGQSFGEQVDIRRVGQDALHVGVKKVDCDVLETTVTGETKKIVSKIYYSKNTNPFVLKSDSSTLAADGVQVQGTARVETIAIDMPYKVLADIKSVTYVRTVQQHVAGGATHTLEVYCAEIPGGVVAHTSKEVDGEGKAIRRSTLELMDYGIANQANAGRLMGLRRVFGHHRRRARPATVEIHP